MSREGIGKHPKPQRRKGGTGKSSPPLPERNGKNTERDALRCDRSGLRCDRNALRYDRNGLRYDRNALSYERGGKNSERCGKNCPGNYENRCVMPPGPGPEGSSSVPGGSGSSSKVVVDRSGGPAEQYGRVKSCSGRAKEQFEDGGPAVRRYPGAVREGQTVVRSSKVVKFVREGPVRGKE